MHSGHSLPALATPLVHTTCVASSESVSLLPGPACSLTHPLSSTCSVTLLLTQKNFLGTGMGGTCLEVPSCCHFRESHAISCCPTPSPSASCPTAPGPCLACHRKARTHTTCALTPHPTPPSEEPHPPFLSFLPAGMMSWVGPSQTTPGDCGRYGDDPGPLFAKRSFAQRRGW